METPSRHHRSGHNIAHRIWRGCSSSQTQEKSWVNKFYDFVNLRVVFQNARRIKSFFNRPQKFKIVYEASCENCDAFNIGKTKRRLHDRKTEEDYMIERLSTSKLSLKSVIFLLIWKILMSTNFLNKLNCISLLTNLQLHDISNILIINFLRISTAHMVRSVSLCLYFSLYIL